MAVTTREKYDASVVTRLVLVHTAKEDTWRLVTYCAVEGVVRTRTPELHEPDIMEIYRSESWIVNLSVALLASW